MDLIALPQNEGGPLDETGRVEGDDEPKESAGVFVLVRTSNPGAAAWQHGADATDGIAGQVADWITASNTTRLGAHRFGPVGAVIGATLPKEAPLWRARMPHAWFLVPGYGAQGASAATRSKPAS